MQKDFDKWNELKKKIDSKTEEERLYFKDGEVWWINLGVNKRFLYKLFATEEHR